MKVSFISKSNVPSDYINELKERLHSLSQTLKPCPFCGGEARMHLNAHVEKCKDKVAVDLTKKPRRGIEGDFEYVSYYTITAGCCSCSITTKQENEPGDDRPIPLLMYGGSKVDFGPLEKQRCEETAKDVYEKWNKRV